MAQIRIAVVDDHNLFREGISLVLNQIEDFIVVYDGRDGQEFIDMLEALVVDVVLLDIEMPGMNGIQATRKALAIKPDLKVIALTMFSDQESYHQMMEAGARGFVLKQASKQELREAIQTVCKGAVYVCRDVLQQLAPSASAADKTAPLLTDREAEIVGEVCNGLKTREIAEKHFISLKTVEAHRTSIFKKAGVRNASALVIWALKNRLVSMPWSGTLPHRE